MNTDAEVFYEERLGVSTGYFNSAVISCLNLTSEMHKRYEATRFYICMSLGNFWKEVRFVSKPTSKQVRKTVKAFKRTVQILNREFNEYCVAEEYGEKYEQ